MHIAGRGVTRLTQKAIIQAYFSQKLSIYIIASVSLSIDPGKPGIIDTPLHMLITVTLVCTRVAKIYFLTYIGCQSVTAYDIIWIGWTQTLQVIIIIIIII